ncbi:Ntn hydrolase family protein [Loigolactobacillus binensis]|uniref:Peptidase n=1 Tax=Loigolactobacillus binensis TaxID=2559922 RepID=A0ABW3EBW8_9LACO|nr:hypothetical protein [Loigolactobacillus binensis]
MTIAIGFNTGEGSIIATDSRLTMQLNRRLFVKSDQTQKIFRINDYLFTTAGQYNLKWNNQWLSVKEFLINFVARHPAWQHQALATALQAEMITTNLDDNDFIMAVGRETWLINRNEVSSLSYTAIGTKNAAEKFYPVFFTLNDNLPLPLLAQMLETKLTEFIAKNPQIGKIGGPVQVAYIQYKNA